MNYDDTDIAAAYDRGRLHGADVLAQWMNELSADADRSATNTIVDLGCGTGRYSEALARHFDAQVIGIDPSVTMLAQARGKPTAGGVSYVRGDGEAMPLRAQATDVVFMSMIFHHLREPVRVAAECRRVLRDGGAAFVRTGVRERIASYPYVPFFPQSRPLLETRLPGIADVQRAFANAGFRVATHRLVVQRIAPTYAAYAEKIAAGSDSVLASLPPAEFDAGLGALRTYASTADAQDVTESIDVFVFR